jgi:hypothetical protein
MNIERTTLPEIALLVCERDLDLFLVEEFAASSSFVEWFLKQIGISGPASVVGISRSVTTSTGESDLEVTLTHGHSVTKLLIENKLDAALQLLQAERYAQRAESYRARATCDSVLTILVAPAKYVGTDTTFRGFQRHLSYDAILEWYREQSESPRSWYKCEILKRAIEKSTRGYPLIPDSGATLFWGQYWQLASSVAPELGMRQPTDKGKRSEWGYLCVRPGLQIIHKLTRGFVDLHVTGYADGIIEFKRQYISLLDSDMRSAPAGKSPVVRINVKPIPLATPFQSCTSVAVDGIRAGSRLLNWYERVVAPTLAT